MQSVREREVAHGPVNEFRQVVAGRHDFVVQFVLVPDLSKVGMGAGVQSDLDSRISHGSQLFNGIDTKRMTGLHVVPKRLALLNVTH